jgi:hypothetical protein
VMPWSGRGGRKAKRLTLARTGRPTAGTQRNDLADSRRPAYGMGTKFFAAACDCCRKLVAVPRLTVLRPHTRTQKGGVDGS